jgi:uncharacterized protein
MPASEPGPAAATHLPPPPSVVLDTNAVLDWLLFDDPGMRAVAAAIGAGQVRWLACVRLREELVHTLQKPLLARRCKDSERLLSMHDRHTWPVPDPAQPAPPTLRCRDATDQVFLDLALAQGAKWLLTHDKALLVLRRRAATRGLVIQHPAEWVPPGPGA